jgi:DnaJ-class molecular chaperone
VNDKLKQETKRRLYLAKKKDKNNAFANLFVACSKCEGSGQLCSEHFENGILIPVLDVCPQCNGNAIVEKNQ